ncbi:hypothetical protein UlMin_029586 [Ulmus minor]
MRRIRSLDVVPIDLDIDRTLRRLRRERKEIDLHKVPIMAEKGGGDAVPNRALKDYSIPNVGISCIQRPPIQANNFEIKPVIIQMIQNSVQFGGLPNDDPNLHIANFLEICDTFKHNGVTDDAVRLRLFPFSLNSKAKAWLISLPPGTITTWEGLVRSFLTKYFPPAKSAKMRNDITNFFQQDQESLYEAWERFKDLLRKCPHHGLPLWMQVQTFYNGLLSNTQTMVDATSGGAFFNKSPEEGYELIEVMAGNNFVKSERSAQKRPAGQGALPSNTERNPREEAKAITLRSGKELEKSKEASKQAIEEDTSVSKNQPATTTIEQTLPKPSFNAVPFPQRLRKQNLDKKFSKFIDIFKSLHINLPFVDMLEQMPKYAKFLKEVLSNKRRLEGNEKVMLTEECSAILQRKLPQKLKDSGSFTIPCTIGDFEFDKVLCDLGASINLMPLSIFRKLGLGEVKPTTVTLQLADRSIKHPRGIIEDVLVKLILRVQDEQVTFNVFEAMKFPSNVNACFEISVLDRVVAEKFHESFPSSSLENCIVNGQIVGNLDDEGIIECVNNLDALPIFEGLKSSKFRDLGVLNVNTTSSIKEPPTLEL